MAALVGIGLENELPVAVRPLAPLTNVDAATVFIFDLDQRRHVPARWSVEYHPNLLALFHPAPIDGGACARIAAQLNSRIAEPAVNVCKGA